MPTSPIPFVPCLADSDMELPPTVDVYRNLNARRSDGQPVYSVRNTTTRKVVCHVLRADLLNVTFVVSDAGRLRVREEQRKNGHAVLRGTPATHQLSPLAARATYNPYKYTTFVNETTLTAVHTAAEVTVNSDGLSYRQ